MFQNVVSCDSASYVCSISNPHEPNSPPKSFTFDGVYGADSTTEAIYNDNGFDLVEVGGGGTHDILYTMLYCRVYWRVITGQCSPMARLGVGRVSPCRESQIRPLREELFLGHSNISLRSGVL